MFDAVVCRKASLSKLIDGVGKQPREDLITSSLFGTIRFLPPKSQNLAIEALIGADLEGDINIHLWPRLKGNGEIAEPDVVIEVQNREQQQFWIVEVKWGASLSNDQVGREIRTVRDGECRRGEFPMGPRRVTGYTLVGAISCHQAPLTAARREFSTSLNMIAFEWATISERLRSLAGSSQDPGLTEWAALAATFLSGQPQGHVLGKWPEMTTPEACTFNFDANESFRWGDRLGCVSHCGFDFRVE